MAGTGLPRLDRGAPFRHNRRVPLEIVGPPMHARIYKPARTAMQSGYVGTRRWVLEFAPEDRKRLDPLMGWTGSGDMHSQVRMRFESKEAAVAYAERHGIPYRVFEPKTRRQVVRPGGYGDNFAYGRRNAWTH